MTSKTVLFLEDELSIFSRYDERIRSVGGLDNILHINRLETCAKALKKFHVDVVLVDADNPKMTLKEIAKYTKKLEFNGPFIFYSGNPSKIKEQIASLFEVYDFVEKPNDEILFQKILEALSIKVENGLELDEADLQELMVDFVNDTAKAIA